MLTQPLVNIWLCEASRRRERAGGEGVKGDMVNLSWVDVCVRERCGVVSAVIVGWLIRLMVASWMFLWQGCVGM